MPNPLMQMLGNMGGTGGIGSMISNMGGPQMNMVAQLMSGKLDGEQLVKNLIAQDPKNAEIWEQAKQMASQGGNPQSAVMQKLQQMGINPADFMKYLK